MSTDDTPSPEYTTNVRRGRERVRMRAALCDGEPMLLWAEMFRDGELSGCGPSLAGVGGDILRDCEDRILLLFPGTMLWRKTNG